MIHHDKNRLTYDSKKMHIQMVGTVDTTSFCLEASKNSTTMWGHHSYKLVWNIILH